LHISQQQERRTQDQGNEQAQLTTCKQLLVIVLISLRALSLVSDQEYNLFQTQSPSSGRAWSARVEDLDKILLGTEENHRQLARQHPFPRELLTEQHPHVKSARRAMTELKPLVDGLPRGQLQQDQGPLPSAADMEARAREGLGAMSINPASQETLERAHAFWMSNEASGQRELQRLLRDLEEVGIMSQLSSQQIRNQPPENPSEWQQMLNALQEILVAYARGLPGVTTEQRRKLA
jgi:hypothetical protein